VSRNPSSMFLFKMGILSSDNIGEIYFKVPNNLITVEHAREIQLLLKMQNAKKGLKINKW
jgi:hypothetical protein